MGVSPFVRRGSTLFLVKSFAYRFLAIQIALQELTLIVIGTNAKNVLQAHLPTEDYVTLVPNVLADMFNQIKGSPLATHVLQGNISFQKVKRNANRAKLGNINLKWVNAHAISAHVEKSPQMKGRHSAMNARKERFKKMKVK